ncbi:MAG: ROK family protein [Bryobacterales bacterium]|nr:ROK family protein [Bryobacterales bacterium]
MGDYAIGVDLGGTNLRAAAISRDGKLLHKVTGAVPVNGGRDAVIADMVGSIETLRDGLPGQTLAGVGVGIPGFILLDAGVVSVAPNLPGFENFAVRDAIEKRLGAMVILENDANAAALGEQWMGAGRDIEDLVLLTLGTGIGGGIIANGRVLHGALGMAGELGHITVSPNGYPCGCGNNGCVEKYASATAVSAMAQLLNLGQGLSSEEVFHLAKSGNERARMIFDTVGDALGILLGNLINTFNFPLYLLGGGLTAAWELFEPAMRKELAHRSFIYRNNPPRVERAALGGDAGLYGAARLPLGRTLL